MTDSTNAEAKGRHKGKEPKAYDSKPKESQKSSEGASGSKIKKFFEKTKCPYCLRGFHLEIQCMKNHIDQLSSLLKQNDISLPQGSKKSDVEPLIKDHDSCHALKVGLTQLKYYMIDSGESNHIVSSKESLSTLTLSRGPSIHMVYDSQIPAVGRGLVKIQHGEFKNVLYIPSIENNLLYVYQMTHIGTPKRVTFETQLKSHKNILEIS